MSTDIKHWVVPVIWQMAGRVEVPKDKYPTLEKAREAVENGDYPETNDPMSLGLPEGEYIEDSFEIDEGGLEIYNSEG